VTPNPEFVVRGGPDGAVVLGMLCGGLVALTVLLVISSAIMRFAVTLANKCLGPANPKPYDDEWEEWEEYDRKSRGRKNNALIPEPSITRGMGIAFVASVVNFIASFAIGLVFGAGMRGMGGRGGPDTVLFILVQGMSLVASFLIWAGILTAMLPTSFGRASLVTLFMGLISFVIALIIAVPVALLTFTVRA
jgi:hypothetical protein